MKHKTLLLTAILTMSIVTIFTACPEPEPEEAEKKPIKPATCDGKPWKPTQWCVTTLASESLDGPYGIALAKDGTLYVTEFNGNKIKKLTLKEDGTLKAVTTIADSGFRLPKGIALAKDGTLYVADTGNHLIKQITPKAGGTFEDPIIIAGDGTKGTDNGIGTTAQFNTPIGIVAAQDKDGNTILYVVDALNNSIRKLEYKEAE